MFYHKLLPVLLAVVSFVSLSYCDYVNNRGAGDPAATSATSAASEPAGAALSASDADADATAAQSMQTDKRGSLTISLDYTKQSGSASNQFAIWIEDANREYVTTLYATRYTANGGYKVRPDSIYEWVGKSGLADMSKTEVDAFSGATPGAGALTYAWDLTGADGGAVPDGGYYVLVEGTLRWKNRVLYTGYIEVGGDPVFFELEPQYTYEGAGNQTALSGDSLENNMITSVSALYVPSVE